jgi:heme/copper-type cytochrome/quinol oxidase subunit 3
MTRVVRPDGERRAPEQPPSTLGLWVFLASLSMLFAASIVGFVVIRLRAESWPPPGAPGLPFSLWISTALAVGCSVATQKALVAIRGGDAVRLNRWLLGAMGCALLFLASQSWGWWVILGQESFRTHLYGFAFIMITGLHGAHVLGGLLTLLVVWILALRDKYSWAHYHGVRNAAIYWHYLTVVWLILFGLLLASW